MDSEEDKELELYIRQQCSWEKLPLNIKKKLDNSKQIWKEKVAAYSIKHQLRWRTNLVKTMVPDEKAYYLEILKYSKNNLMLYPYHISDVLVKGLRVTPFKYYLEMMEDVMNNDYSYDRIPNFTATDCVRLLGIGRNEFIDTLNKCRSKGWWKKKNVKSLLPTQPIDIIIEHWWLVNVGYVTEEDVKFCSEVEKDIIDALIDVGSIKAGKLDKQAVKSLYTKGLIFLDVPIENTDHIAVPPLENFVMNRVGGDYFENLLYKIFVSTDERTSIEKLANILDIDIEDVKQAVSMYCRLGFAKKKDIEPLSDPVWHTSWQEKSEQDENNLLRRKTVPERFVYDVPLSTKPNAVPSIKTQATIEHSSLPPHNREESGKRIGFIFDYTLTALLMMGNLGPGLKSHAVTMYEVGKLADESLNDFIGELNKVSEVAEGEAQRYNDHALALKQTLTFLRYNFRLNIPECEGGVDLLRAERLTSLEPETLARILIQNYSLLISMAPISPETKTISSCLPIHFGQHIPEMNSPWFKLFIYNLIGSGPSSIAYSKGSRVRSIPDIFQRCDTVVMCTWNKEPAIIHLNNLLPILNENLLDTPVLVQEYAQIGSYIEQVDVPFPFDIIPEGEQTENCTEDTIQKHPLLQKLQKLLNLQYSFGIIKMLKIQHENSLNWIPFQLSFGMPLGNLKHNQAICQKIQQYRLFAPENLKRYSRQSRELTLTFLDFISAQLEEDLEFETDHEIPFPRKPILFLQGSLKYLPRKLL